MFRRRIFMMAPGKHHQSGDNAGKETSAGDQPLWVAHISLILESVGVERQLYPFFCSFADSI